MDGGRKDERMNERKDERKNVKELIAITTFK